MIVVTVGQRMKKRIEELGITQKEIAQKLGIATSTLNGYFNDTREPDYATLVKLSDVLDLSVDYLLTGKRQGTKKESSEEDMNSKTQDLLELIEDFSVEEYRQMVSYARFLSEQRKQQEHQE